MTPQELKKKHDAFIRLREEGWNKLKFIVLYDFEELVLHLLLNSEAFYVKDERTMNQAMMYVQDCYPYATMDDLERVYEQYKDVVTEVYG